jgi:acetyltransferase
VPFLQGAEYGLRAVAALMRYAVHLRDRRSAAEARLTPDETASAARAVLQQASGARLSTTHGSDILRAYGIPSARQALATSASEALDAAERLGYPVAAKVEAPSLAHKAAAGGVVLNIASPEAVVAAFNRLTRLVDDAHGVLMQQMVADGVAEVILGMSRDAQFGPVIAVGLGGVLVEMLRDVQLLLPPVTRRDATAALQRLRGAALLEGADVDALVEVVLRFSELCQDVGDWLRAIDINPLIVRPVGQGLTAVDSLFELEPERSLSVAGTRFAAK